MENKENRRAYNRFRKHIIREGYQRIQLSVYLKVVHNINNTKNEEKLLKSIIPNKSNVFILKIPSLIFENAYIANLEIDVGKLFQDIIYI